VILMVASVRTGTAWSQPASLEVERVDEVNISVTAPHRTSPLQKTPAAITAILPETIAAAHAEDARDLSRLAPSLTVVDSGPSSLRLVIRGVQAVGEQTTGVYYDETPLNGSVGPTNDAAGSTPALRLVDVERVEVMRGPQGTLYGAGAMGGAVRILFKRPSFRYEAAVRTEGSGTRGGEPGYGLDGVVNAPLVSDRLAVRLVGFERRRGGYVDNGFLGRSDIDFERFRGGRVLARFAPVSALTIDGAVFHERVDSSSSIWTKEAGRSITLSQIERPNHDRLTLYNLTARWDLGPLTATAVASHTRRRFEQILADVSYQLATYLNNPGACMRLRGADSNGDGMRDTPCTPEMMDAFNNYVDQFVPSGVYPKQSTDSSIGELRFTSTGERRLNYTFGIHASQRDGTLVNASFPAEPTTGALVQPMVPQFRRTIDERLQQLATYGELMVPLTAGLKLTGGTRFFHYRRRVGGQTEIPLDLINAPPTGYARFRSRESGWVSKLVLAQEVADRALFYGQAAQGFRPGGVNQVPDLPPELGPYRADRTWNYEVGAKTTWFGQRLAINASAYWIEWSDMQVAGSRPDGLFRFVSNAGAARILGVEAEVSGRPLSGLEVGAFASLARARLTEDQRNASVVAPGRAGDRIPYVPQGTAGMAGEYTRGLSSYLAGSMRFDVSYVGSAASELRSDNPFYRRIESRWLLGARLSVEARDQRWQAALFAQNLLNQASVTTATATGVSTGQTLVSSVPQLTVGLELRLRL
jgi:iron complex outermembrane receptor protein